MKIDIKKTCKSHGVSLVSLAERLGVSRQTVHYYCEQGDRNPVAQLQRIADAIGCSVSDFFRRGGTAGPSADEYDHLPQVRDGAGDKRKGINKTTFL